MVQRPLVIVHGWSDRAASFAPLAQYLSSALGRPIHQISLVDYVSMDDAVTFTDLAEALQRAWVTHGLPMRRRSCDVVAHSMGALVVRAWMAQCLAPDNMPMYRLLMLAPANFGSPLAHKGRSFIGRVVKGFTNEKMFQVGARLLEGLELASPFTWDLALRDCFGPTAAFGPGRVLATVLAGGSGYSGIAAAANTEGSDGVVRCASADLNPTLLRADFTNPLEPAFALEQATGATAFAVIAEEHHSSIAGGFRSPRTPELIASALSVTDETFGAWRARLASRQPATAAERYQQTVFRVHDQHGEPVPDYFLEFYVDDDDRNWFAEMFHRDAIRSVHVNHRDPSHRAVLIDCALLHAQLDKVHESMRISLTAQPELGLGANVGFRTFRDANMSGIRIPRDELPVIFRANRTLLVDVTLKREQAPQLVTMRPARLPRQPAGRT